MFTAAMVRRKLKRARAAQERGEHVVARALVDDALRSARLSEDWAVVGHAALEKARIEREMKNLQAAEHHFLLAATQFSRAPRSASTVRGRVDALEALAEVLMERGKSWDAYRTFAQGAEVAGVKTRETQPDDILTDAVTREEMVWTAHLATSAAAAGRHKLARSHYERVMDGCVRLRDVFGQITCHRGLARLAENQMDWATTAHHLYEASNLYPELDDPERHIKEWVECLRELGLAYKQLGRREEQIRAFKLAVRLEQVAGSQP